MTLKDRIAQGTPMELARLAIKLSMGQGPKFNGQPVILTYKDIQGLYQKHRPSLDWADVEACLMEIEEQDGRA